MPKNIFERAKDAWKTLLGKPDGASQQYGYYGMGSYRADKFQLSGGSEKTIIASVYTRLALDVSSIDIKHVRLNDKGRYSETLKSGLNNCLMVEANKDQSGFAFKEDLVLSMLDEGCVAIVPTEIDNDELFWTSPTAYEIRALRVGKITEWFPNHVKILLYNDTTGMKEEIILPKKTVAIIENPFYAVMNEPNSTLRRLVHKLSLLDAADDKALSGKMDLIIQMPYTIKSEYKRNEAERRLELLESQLNNSTYGIGYIDATEHITQLNRPVENQLIDQIKYLTSMLFSQLGITQEILDGTASEDAMANYNKKAVEPIITAIVSELSRKYITPTGRSQRQAIMFFNDPFKVVTATQIPDLADKLTRNEIMTSNEIRQIIGIQPAEDPSADELRNKNLNQSATAMRSTPANETPKVSDENSSSYPATASDDIVNSLFNDLEAQIDDIVNNYLNSDSKEDDADESDTSK